VAPSAVLCANLDHRVNGLVLGSEQADGNRYRHIEQTSSKK